MVPAPWPPCAALRGPEQQACGLAGLFRPTAPLADVRIEQCVRLAAARRAAAHDGPARAAQRRADGAAQVREDGLLGALRPTDRVGHQPGRAWVAVEPHLPCVQD